MKDLFHLIHRIIRRKTIAAPVLGLVIVSLVLSSCLPSPEVIVEPLTTTPGAPGSTITITPLATRPVYGPGELVDYTVQDGDTLPALSARFNTSVEQIRKANPIIPDDVTTLPPGMPMQIPIYYLPLWGTQYQILPNALYVNGPAEIGFDAVSFCADKPGWLKDYTIYAYDGWRTGPEVVAYIGMSYSISPRLLLALLEYRFGALSDPEAPSNVDRNLLGYTEPYHANLYYQLLWFADFLNEGYYSWQTGTLLQQELADGELERFDPWQNAATVSLQRYFAMILPVDQYRVATSSDGYARVYTNLFGDPSKQIDPIIPGSLVQPEMKLPFVKGKAWSFTGAPHPIWGEAQPWAALDFAPPADKSGCAVSFEWVTAVADGVLSRTEPGLAILDLDGDGDERTGWVVLYLHLAFEDAAPQGKALKAGDVIGHPSCERGKATGTHVHVGRKYNGQWMPADSVIPFDMEGWIAESSGTAYFGYLNRNNKTVRANSSGDARSLIISER
jgi:LasA protease